MNFFVRRKFSPQPNTKGGVQFFLGKSVFPSTMGNVGTFRHLIGLKSQLFITAGEHNVACGIGKGKVLPIRATPHNGYDNKKKGTAETALLCKNTIIYFISIALLSGPRLAASKFCGSALPRSHTFACVN
jgi:hypothetical protein